MERASGIRSVRNSFRLLSGGAALCRLGRGLREAVDVGISERVGRVGIKVDPPFKSRWVRLEVAPQSGLK